MCFCADRTEASDVILSMSIEQRAHFTFSHHFRHRLPITSLLGQKMWRTCGWAPYCVQLYFGRDIFSSSQMNRGRRLLPENERYCCRIMKRSNFVNRFIKYVSRFRAKLAHRVLTQIVPPFRFALAIAFDPNCVVGPFARSERRTQAAN